MRLLSILDTRVRGFRVVDVAALAIFLVLALAVYGFKTFAGRERADILDVESQIQVEDRQVRLLKAEIAGLESPARLEQLATRYAGLAPISPAQEVTVDGLAQVAAPKPAAALPAAPAPQTSATPPAGVTR